MSVLSFLQQGDDNLLVYWNGVVGKNQVIKYRKPLLAAECRPRNQKKDDP
jgi:hypothetical protein